MTEPAAAKSATTRRYGPEVGEPPVFVDPRRWGSLIGLAGGLVFIVSYSGVFGTAVRVVASVAGAVLVLLALAAHYLRPVALGPMTRPRPLALATYVACVVGELALISVGSRALTAADHEELRPALIAAVVGLHFIPFAWAFQERMFYWLGGALGGLGVLGLLLGALGVEHAPEAFAVLGGFVMLIILTRYARGRFAPAASGDGTPAHS